VGIVGALLDLVLPTECGGCGGPAGLAGICPACTKVLAEPARWTRPQPAPPGLPECFAGGEYDGELRSLILAYKEKGRRGLSAALGSALAQAVRAGWPDPALGPVVLVPVPATAAAVRARHGDHMLRLARRAAVRLRAAGYAAAVASPVRALPRPDSAHLSSADRALTAGSAFALRTSWAGRLPALATVADRGAIVLVDDVLTTGATLAAVADVLLAAGVTTTFAATLAATRRRRDRALSPIAQISVTGSRDGGDAGSRRS
jgi:predicted amidophosphoribosyltransferase